MSDLQAEFAEVFADFGETIVIDGVDVKALAARPGPVVEPYYDDEGGGLGNAMRVIVQKDDLDAIGQWPLSDPEVEVDAIVYRIIRSFASLGHVILYLQEAS